jgi:hypothetical protein
MNPHEPPKLAVRPIPADQVIATVDRVGEKDVNGRQAAPLARRHHADTAAPTGDPHTFLVKGADMERLQRAALPLALVYLWVMMILLGAIVLETFMVYPNIFADPPASLALAMEFMTARGPDDFFPPFGFLSWVSGAGSLVVAWRVPRARWWVAASLLAVVADGLVSILFFWPRNEVMFVEGSAVHSAEVLRQTAREFEALHWSRLVLNAAGAVFAFAGFLALYRETILAARGSLALETGVVGGHR